ncbi:unnamed protein product [Effrenium voratum]|nr:unnamed protein product [Effrenium voratum]
MIQANKATVVTEFHKQALEVRNMELEYYLLVFDKISTISALLAGFASTAVQVEVPKDAAPPLKTLYLLSAASALGAHLLVVVVCTMCTMWGPGHALRGQETPAAWTMQLQCWTACAGRWRGSSSLASFATSCPAFCSCACFSTCEGECWFARSLL